jgi:Ca2+/H+ antiporter
LLRARALASSIFTVSRDAVSASSISRLSGIAGFSISVGISTGRRFSGCQ